jgi:hypothetical protein
VDSLGVNAVEIGCMIAPDRRQHRQNALKRCLTMPASFSHFLANPRRQRGRRDPLCPFHATPQQWGASKSMNHPGGGCPPACSGTFCAFGVMGLRVRRRGLTGEGIADVIDPKNHFHVSATSSAVLSANRRRCRDLKALCAAFTSAMGAWS